MYGIYVNPFARFMPLTIFFHVSILTFRDKLAFVVGKSLTFHTRATSSLVLRILNDWG